MKTSNWHYLGHDAWSALGDDELADEGNADGDEEKEKLRRDLNHRCTQAGVVLRPM